MLTRKHYNLLADAIKETSDGQDNVRTVVEGIAEALYFDNPDFNHDRFMEACGFKD